MQFDSLILDDQDLSKGLSDDDKKYLEEFIDVKILSLTNTKINALNKLPDLKELERVYCFIGYNRTLID